MTMTHSLGASEPANTEPESAAVADDDDAVTSHDRDGQQGGALVFGPRGARCGKFTATGMLTTQHKLQAGGSASWAGRRMGRRVCSGGPAQLELHWQVDSDFYAVIRPGAGGAAGAARCQGRLMQGAPGGPGPGGVDVREKF
jgi:hypothetical protein